MEGDDKPAKKKFRKYPIGYFHIDIAEVRTEEGKLYLLVTIDRTSKFAYAKLQPKATKMIAAAFLHHLIAAVPYTIHTILSDNGIQFTHRKHEPDTLKEATVKRYDYQTHQQLKKHLFNFLNAYHFAKRLKTLKGLSPYEYIIKCWQNKPQRFRIKPNHHTMGLNISRELTGLVRFNNIHFMVRRIS